MSLITIDQLLETVVLDFEPRWVTKDKNGRVNIWSEKPYRRNTDWDCELVFAYAAVYDGLKLSEFSDKDWQECIYEVPRKTTGKIEKLLEQKLTIGKTKYEYPTHAMLMAKINELVDMVNNIISVQEKMIDSRFVVNAVNELKGAKNE